MAKKLYNLIILDRSGSMSSIINPTIAGVNETLSTIRMAQQKTDIQQSVTLVSFCGCSTSAFCDNVNISKVKEFTRKDYEPCCNTPLYDAIGEAVTKLKTQVSKDPEAAVSVTIITDGYENSSRKWNRHSIKALIELLKAEGWLFAFIGANQDVDQVGDALSIDNRLAFSTARDEDVDYMFQRERESRIAFACCLADDGDLEEARRTYFKKK